MADPSEARPANLTALRDWLAKLRLEDQPGEAAKLATDTGGPASPQQQPSASTAMLVVARTGPGDYTTLTEAVRKAPAGARILVRPGRYEEGVVLEKPLEIVGDGPRQDIVIANPDTHCIQVRTNQAVIRGLTLRSQGASKGNKRSAVDIPQGQALVEDCDLSSDTQACVAVQGPTPNPVIRNCVLRDGKSSGLLVGDNARATVEECEFYGNAEAGILIRTGGNPIIRRCRIHDGKLFGVMVDEWGRGTIEDCEFFANAEAAVGISGGNPLVRRCRIHKEKVGILAFTDGVGTVEECDFFDNAIGVLFAEGGNTLLRRCQIHDSTFYGVSAKQKGRGTVEDCDLFRCAKAEVHVVEGSTPVIRRCRIHDGQQFGVFVNAAGVGTVEECDIFGNALAEVAISEDGNPLVRRCRIHDGKRFGVSSQLKGQGEILDCEITGHAQAGVLIRTGGHPALRRCKINRNGAQAVRAQLNAGGLIENCDLTGNARGAWDIEANCRVQRRGNTE